MNKLTPICCALSILMGTAYAVEPNPSINHEVTTMDDEQPKRAAPKPVEPVEINKVRYEVVRAAKAHGFGQDGGVIVATDTTTGKELWTLKVYQTHYDQAEEQDVQEVYITKLTPCQDNTALQVENEARKTYLVNLNTREVSELK